LQEKSGQEAKIRTSVLTSFLSTEAQKFKEKEQKGLLMKEDYSK